MPVAVFATRYRGCPMTFDLQRLIDDAKDAVKGNPCEDGDHD